MIINQMAFENQSKVKKGVDDMPKIKRTGSDPKFDNQEFLQKVEQDTMANLMKMMGEQVDEKTDEKPK